MDKLHRGPLLVALLLSLYSVPLCSKPSSIPSSIQDIIRNIGGGLGLKSFAQRRFGGSSGGRGSYALATAREYGGGGGGGYGGGGGGGYGGGSGGGMSYASNYDTALTALAFLSFGVFLLNLLLMALNRTNGSRRRRAYEGDIYSFTELMTLVQNAISSSVFDTTIPECALSSLCTTKERIRTHRDVSNIIEPFKSLGLDKAVYDWSSSPIWKAIIRFLLEDCIVYQESCPSEKIHTDTFGGNQVRLKNPEKDLLDSSQRKLKKDMQNEVREPG